VSDAPVCTRRRPRLTALVALALGVWVAQLGLSNAAFTGSTVSAGNDIGALTVAPPPTAAAAMTLNVLPLLTCRVDLSWSASTTPGVTGYEVVRVTASTGVVAAGPWTVAGTAFVDDPVPLQVVSSAFEWRVTALFGSWRSAYTVAIPDNLLICLL
jgi:hypothetical protein